MTNKQYKPDDQLELDRFKREVTRRNAYLVDREVKWLREMRLHEVNMLDPHARNTITNSYHFHEEDAALAAVTITRELCGET